MCQSGVLVVGRVSLVGYGWWEVEVCSTRRFYVWFCNTLFSATLVRRHVRCNMYRKCNVLVFACSHCDFVRKQSTWRRFWVSINFSVFVIFFDLVRDDKYRI